MTLVVAMATADSVVIAADRRVRIKKGVFNDTVVKLVKLSATTLGSATGSVRLLGHGSDVIRFDVYELMRHFFADQQFSGEKLVAFEEHLKATFAQYCNTYRPSEFVDVSFQLVIYTRWNADFMLHQRQCKTIDSGALGINRANTICKHSGVNPFGDVDVINEITGGNNPAFADLRSDPEVKRFVIGRLGCAIGSVSKDEALAFCPKLITLCNERYPLLGKGESPIGPTYNLGTIMAEGCEIH